MGKRENTKIIFDGFNAEPPLSDNAILQELFEKANVPFGELRTVFNDIIKEKGLRLTSKERKLKTAELMEGVTEIKDGKELLLKVDMLEIKLKVTSTKAMGSLRTWAKAAGIELPKAPRAESVRKVGFGGHYKNILDYVLGKRSEHTGEGDFELDKKDIVVFCHKNGIPEAYSTTAMNVVHFAKRWNGEIEDEVGEAEEAESED